MPRYIIYKILALLRLCREFSEETYPNCLIWKVQLALLPTSVSRDASECEIRTINVTDADVHTHRALRSPKQSKLADLVWYYPTDRASLSNPSAAHSPYRPMCNQSKRPVNQGSPDPDWHDLDIYWADQDRGIL